MRVGSRGGIEEGGSGLPHWNASLDQHQGLCRGISRLGISALRISLPYHDDYRMPPGTAASRLRRLIERRTHDLTRRGRLSSTCAAASTGSRVAATKRLGIVGTSLGSYYAFLASAHDERLAVNVFNHCSSYVADVVWTGLSTQHIRQGIEGDIGLEQLREVWMAISPANYMDKFARDRGKKSNSFTQPTTLRFCRSFRSRPLRGSASGGSITRLWCCLAVITPWVSRRSSSWMDIISARS